MKKLKLSIIIFLFTLSVCLFCSTLTVKIMKQVEQYTNNVKIIQSKESARELVDFWDKESKILYVFIHHDILDRITKNISKINAAIQKKDFEYAFIECECILSLSKVLREYDDINLRNIL
ncbi:MAG: DUF4363 family protein [Candidatus Improbicoccus pseudotrichonymphae]|uniref:DUF4363 family protein n=1 Tax=Candidatus Improbicoccus pseudotrichonymphae TaxID=3033792 RepID=A0AA48IH69_9FIRM|nr:MAG: DUF4363 family protein [Candidatus Improbicoccus pseudotrichonymphae]